MRAATQPVAAFSLCLRCTLCGRRQSGPMSVTAPLTSPVSSAVSAKAGRFGVYGGRYVPETLMAALEELEQAYAAADADPAFHAELDDLLHHYCGRPTPLYFAKRMTRAAGRREDLPEARGPAAHRRAQDQQRAGPGAAGAADGQAADHRRDRRGPAWRGDGDGLRAVRAGVRDLHGRGGHAAAGAERLPHAAAGRGGARR